MPDYRREHGLDPSDRFVLGPPRVLSESDMSPCPHCQCATLYEIVVRVKHPLLAGAGYGTGRYVGCPACPFASPMLMVGDPTGSGDDHAA